ncbi:MAG: phosphotransferase family protein [Chloroflexi bacterium]|nr:phosphotransferase family protein [Chloroflexota bacterium]MBI3762866.1 phosphotransferase family protein [Chloroflexota bacterium]
MPTDFTDRPTSVRPGEEIDAGRLETYLKGHIPGLTGPVAVEQFPSGYSNLTYLIRAGDRELVLRRPPFNAKIKTAHDMGREYKVLSHLIRVYAKVPRPLAYCEDESVIGAPFYVMERVKGVILRATPPPHLKLSPEIMRRIATSFVDNLAELHASDYTAAGLGDLGNPQGYIERQISGWTKRYQNSRTDDISEMDRIAEWMARHQPPESGAALIHNDYKYDNLVLEPSDLGRIVAVLDWEMATVGDPFMDLGTTLGYWTEPDDPDELAALVGLTRLPGNLTRRQLVDRYAEKSGRDIPDPLFYYVYGLFKIGVIVQQIYFRFRQGHTRDERFAFLIHVVHACARQACLAIDRGHL